MWTAHISDLFMHKRTKDDCIIIVTFYSILIFKHKIWGIFAGSYSVDADRGLSNERIA